MSNQNFNSLPKPHTTYVNIIKSLLPIGDHEKAQQAVLPEATYTVTQLVIDQDNLADYRKICGFDNNSYVPPTYFAVLSQTLQMNMMVKEPFPFAMLGLIHVKNSVTQYRYIKDTAAFKMAVSFANLREHERGQQFDFVTQVFEADELVWEGTSTYSIPVKRKNCAKTCYQQQLIYQLISLSLMTTTCTSFGKCLKTLGGVMRLYRGILT